MPRTGELSSWEEKKLAEFLAASESFRAITTPYIAVAALRSNEGETVISARLVFGSPTAIVEQKSFESQSLRVFLTRLPDVPTAEGIIRAAMSGSFEVNGQAYQLYPRATGGGGVTVEALNEAIGPQMRLCALLIRGREMGGFADPQQIDWELRASDPPYLALTELLQEFGLPPLGTHGTFEVYHSPPVAIDRERSYLCGTVLSISIRLEKGLCIEDAQLGVVAMKAGETSVRKTFRACELTWTRDGEIQLGTIKYAVPSGRAVQSIAVFKGVAFHYWWVLDPLQIPNTRKAVYEVIDPDVAILRDFMTASGSKGSARDLESAVAWLLWMLGFSVAQLGTNTRTQDAVDILAVTPTGNFALVECTTGVISTDKKVANLLSRKAIVLERLVRASHNTVRVMAVLVTSRGRDEVLQEIKPAQERGVFVITRDDLVDLLNRTNVLPDADELYNNAESQLATATASEPSLPGIS
jgi:hypothetical protein